VISSKKEGQVTPERNRMYEDLNNALTTVLVMASMYGFTDVEKHAVVARDSLLLHLKEEIEQNKKPPVEGSSK
jgi:hypothetical protein